MDKRLRLHTLLFIAFILISSLPVLVLALWVQQNALHKEIRDVEEKHLLIAKNLTGSLSRYLKDLELVFDLTAERFENGHNNVGIENLLKNLNIKSLVIINNEGQITWLADGLASNNSGSLPLSILKQLEPFMIQAKRKSPGNVFTNLIADQQGKPAIFLMKSLPENRYLLARMGTEYIEEIQQKIAFGRRGHAAIVDRKGQVMAHPLPEWVASMKDISHIPPVTRMMKGETGVTQFYTPAMQADMIAGHTVVPRTGWGVMVPQPFEELEESAASYRTLALLVALAGIIIAGLISWWIARSLAKPISAVARSAKEAAEGELRFDNSELQGVVTEDVKSLVEAFRTMVIQINEQKKQLQITTNRLEEAHGIARFGNWEWNAGDDSIWCSNQVYEILGRPEKDIQNTRTDYLELVHPADRSELMGKMDRALEENSKTFIEHRILMPDGSTRFVSQTFRRSLDHDTDTVVGVMHDINQRKLQEQEILYKAHYDELTGLPNRVLMEEQLGNAIIRAERNKSAIALLYLDLDHFKNINDTLGHHAGDLLLQKAASRLSESLREIDFISRMGGDEFMILDENLENKENAAQLSRRIIQLLAEPFRINGEDYFLGASIGISLYPDDARDPMHLMRCADIAMYRAKQSGRSCFHYYTQEMDQDIQKRTSLGNDLRTALEKEELEMYFQPVFDSHTNTLYSAEALIRWQHRKKGMISPAAFIPLAEEMDLIAELGDFALRQSCQALSKWQKVSGQAKSVSVNLSILQIRKGLTPQRLLEIVTQNNLLPNQLILEFTESQMIEHSEETIDWLAQVKNTGIRFAMDDFGTGFSSLSYLHRLPLDVLKIDMSFVSAIGRDPASTRLINSIISMARIFKLKVVAEGVETDEQKQYLQAQGCDYLQGYLLARPMPGEDFIEFIQQLERAD